MIRFARYEDYNHIHEMLQDIHGMHVKEEPKYYKKINEVISLSDFNNEVDKKHVFVYEENEKILAYAIFAEMLISNHPIIVDQKVLMIDDICVLKSERGRGIGKELFAYIERYAKENNYTNIDLNVWTFNTDALNFYKSMGMRETRVKMSKSIE